MRLDLVGNTKHIIKTYPCNTNCSSPLPKSNVTNSINLTPYGGELAMGLNRQNFISICDSIWLGTNSIKLTRYGGELGGGELGGSELAMGRNRQLPLGAIYPCAQQFFESVARVKL